MGAALEEPGVPRRSPKELDLAIRGALVGGPRMKWELRVLLHEPESYIFQRLKALKRAGWVKVVGTNSDRRGWALCAPPPAEHVALKATDTRKGRRCEKCQYRWAQVRGLCRHCDQQMNALATSRFEQEQTRRERHAARVAALRPPASKPHELREVTIGHETFLVMWDGT